MMQENFPNLTILKAPQCYDFSLVDNLEFWSTMLSKFPVEHQTKKPLFKVDRILPLPKPARNALIENYFDQDQDMQELAKNDPDNKDCLVRVYLGEKESVAQQEDVYDSLRNFPLRLNMMEDLNLEVFDLANEMAIGLAILHWKAMVDGMDIEFVLGSSATRDEPPRAYDDTEATPHKIRAINFKRRAVHMWMLDLDKATSIKLSREDVDKRLVPAFLGNDPYYPRQHVDSELWDEFCTTYLKASDLILRAKGADEVEWGLPGRFLNEVVRISKEQEAYDEEDGIEFAD